MFEALIDRLTRASLRFKWVTIGLSIFFIVAGIFALTQLNQELIPPIDFPQTVVLAFNPGAEPEAMRDEVTIPLEEALSDIDGIVNIESTSSNGVAFIIAMSEFGLDMEAIREDIQAAIDGLEYPEGMETPKMLTFSLSDLPIISVSVSAADLSLAELKEFVEVEIVPELETIPDVAAVEVSGGQELPGESPPTPEPTEEPKKPAPPPTLEPTLEPTAAQTNVPVEEPEEGEAAGAESVALPESWVQTAASQGAVVETTDDLPPEFIDSIASMAPQMLDELTPEMLLAMPVDTLAALPEDYLTSLEPELQTQLAARLTPAEVEEPEPVALPESWIQGAAAQGVTIETTDDLTPEFIGSIASMAPQMLDELTPEMLLAMPDDALVALPEDYLTGLAPDLQTQLAGRITAMLEPEEEAAPRELPSAWQSAGQSQGITLLYPEDVTPEIVKGIAEFAPKMFDQLTPVHLREFSPEALGWLPAEYIEGLDLDLYAELGELAQPVGGLGMLAVEAEAEAEALSEGALELTGAWQQPPPEDSAGPMPSFETAADLMTSGFADSAADLLNLLVESGQEQTPQLMADLTPEVITWLVENEEDFLKNLSPATLRLLSPEVLSALPEDFLASLDEDLRAELEGIAAGTVEVFIPTNTINRVNGNPSLALSIFKDGGANTVSVSHAAFDKLNELETAHPGLRFDVVFEQSSFIEESIDGVLREGGLGAVFAVLVILFFLSGRVNGKYKLSWRSTLVIGTSIPLSIFMAFTLLRWLPPVADLVLAPLENATAGIAVLGTLVASIHHLFPTSVTLNIMTLSGMTVAIGRVVDDSIVVLENVYRHIQRGEDRKQSVLIGTRDVAIAIFASTVTTVVVFLPIGLLGGFIGAFFLPFGVAVTYALMSSFIVAVTIVPLLAYLFIRKENLPSEDETALQRWYTPVLKWALDKRVTTLTIAAVLLIGSLFLLGGRPRAFMPNMGEVQINASVELPNGPTMVETNDLVAEFEIALADIKGLGVIHSEIGSTGGMAARFMGGGINQAAASISIGVENAAELDALTVKVRQAAEDIFGPDNVTVSGGTLASSAFGSFALVLSGDPDQLAVFNDQAIATLSEVEGLANVSSNLANGDMILRVDGQPAVRYTGELETEDALGVTEEAKAALEAIVPAGITVSEGFETKAQTEGFADAIQAIIVSIVVVYLVMVVTFRSFVHPFTILFSLPLAIIGAAVALWATDRVVGISALVGMMMLVGIVVTNAIVLLDRVQVNRKKRGMSTHDALVEAGRTRLRPILMTAIAAILAMLPMALGFTEGAIIASELATVVIGGLFTSTVLTLLVVPVMYNLLDRFSGNKKAAAK